MPPRLLSLTRSKSPRSSLALFNMRPVLEMYFKVAQRFAGTKGVDLSRTIRALYSPLHFTSHLIPWLLRLFDDGNIVVGVPQTQVG